MKRVMDVVRIQSVSRMQLVGLPLLILFGVFALNWALFAVIRTTTGEIDDKAGTGAVCSIFFVLAISHLQSMTQVFPFALGISVTRRNFFAGTGVVVLAQALTFGLLLAVLERIERATNGWGTSMWYFAPMDVIHQDSFVLQWLVYAVPFVAVSMLGVFAGVVFKRWGQTGSWVMSLGLAALIVAGILLATWQQWWGAVGAFFTGTSSVALLAGYPLVIAAVAAVAGWLALRRATP